MRLRMRLCGRAFHADRERQNWCGSVQVEGGSDIEVVIRTPFFAGFVDVDIDLQKC